MEVTDKGRVCAEDCSSPVSNRRGLTAKSLVTSLVILVFCGLAIVGGPTGRQLSNPMYLPSTTGMGSIILIIVILNPVLKLLRSRLVFDRAEKVIVYNVVFLGTVMMGTGFFLSWMYSVTALARLTLYNTDLYRPLLDLFSSAVMITDMQAAKGFELGGAVVPWRQWIAPLLLWGIVFAIYLFMNLCIAVLVRRRWTDHEHLMYPVTVPILETVDIDRVQMNPLWTSRPAWVAVAFMVLFKGLAIAHRYYPVVPYFSTMAPGDMIKNILPRQAFEIIYYPGFWFHLDFNPLMIGFAWLVVSSHILFSVWFFYIAKFVFLAGLKSMGIMGAQGFPNVTVHYVATNVMLALVYIYLMKGELKSIVCSSLNPHGCCDDSDEPLPYRVAVIGGLLAFALLLMFTWIFLKVELWLATISLLVLLFSIVASARMRSEGGIAWNAKWTFPLHLSMQDIFGGARISTGSVCGLPGIGMFICFHNALLSSFLEGFRMADAVMLNRRSLAKAFFIALIAALVLGSVIILPSMYNKGPGAFEANNEHFFGKWAYNNAIMRSQADTPESYGWAAGLSAGIGVIAVGVLTFMTTRFPWWPFHPIGYVAGTAAGWTWVFAGSFFIVWVIKGLVMRYGGRSLYQRITPFFITLIIMDVIMSWIDGLLSMVF